MGLREELELSFTEHIILEHHESITPYWYHDNYYAKERNNLIANGIIFPFDNYFAIPEEIIPHIRKTWGYYLTNKQYYRLLNNFTSNDLQEILKEKELPISGTIDEKSNRIIENHISSKKALEILSVDSIKDVLRKIGAQVSGTKNEIIANLIDFVEDDEDLRVIEENEQKKTPPPVEEKKLTYEKFTYIFSFLSNDQIYSIASSLRNVQKSGNKERKILKLWESNYSEITFFYKLTNGELYELCSKLGLKVSGSKQDRVERIIHDEIEIISPNDSDDDEKDASELIAESTKKNRDHQFANEENKEIDELKGKYSFLSNDELMILSFILKTKSVSEQQLERLIARFDIPWFYPSGKMKEMIEKLESNGQSIISMRRIGDYSLYEVQQ